MLCVFSKQCNRALLTAIFAGVVVSGAAMQSENEPGRRIIRRSNQDPRATQANAGQEALAPRKSQNDAPATNQRHPSTAQRQGQQPSIRLSADAEVFVPGAAMNAYLHRQAMNPYPAAMSSYPYPQAMNSFGGLGGLSQQPLGNQNFLSETRPVCSNINLQSNNQASEIGSHLSVPTLHPQGSAEEALALRTSQGDTLINPVKSLSRSREIRRPFMESQISHASPVSLRQQPDFISSQADQKQVIDNHLLATIPCVDKMPTLVHGGCYITKNQGKGKDSYLIIPLDCPSLRAKSFGIKEIRSYCSSPTMIVDRKFIRETLMPTIFGDDLAKTKKSDAFHRMNPKVFQNNPTVWDLAFLQTYSLNCSNNEIVRLHKLDDEAVSSQNIEVFDNQFYRIAPLVNKFRQGRNQQAFSTCNQALGDRKIISQYISVALPCLAYGPSDCWAVYIWDIGVNFSRPWGASVTHNFLRPLKECDNPVKDEFKNMPVDFCIVKKGRLIDELKTLKFDQADLSGYECISKQVLTDRMKAIIELKDKDLEKALQECSYEELCLILQNLSDSTEDRTIKNLITNRWLNVLKKIIKQGLSANCLSEYRHLEECIKVFDAVSLQLKAYVDEDLSSFKNDLIMLKGCCDKLSFDNLTIVDNICKRIKHSENELIECQKMIGQNENDKKVILICFEKLLAEEKSAQEAYSIECQLLHESWASMGDMCSPEEICEIFTKYFRLYCQLKKCYENKLCVFNCLEEELFNQAEQCISKDSELLPREIILRAELEAEEKKWSEVTKIVNRENALLASKSKFYADSNELLSEIDGLCVEAYTNTCLQKEEFQGLIKALLGQFKKLSFWDWQDLKNGIMDTPKGVTLSDPSVQAIHPVIEKIFARIKVFVNRINPVVIA